jgi:hypothetical protein
MNAAAGGSPLKHLRLVSSVGCLPPIFNPCMHLGPIPRKTFLPNHRGTPVPILGACQSLMAGTGYNQRPAATLRCGGDRVRLSTDIG